MHNSNHDIADKILKRIGESNVSPAPKLFFSARNAVLWLLAVLTTLVGSLAVSSIIFRIVNIQGVLSPHLGAPALPLLARLIPFLWIGLFGIFFYTSYLEIRATRRGYKFELSTLVLGVLLTSCVFGIAFYATGVGASLDRYASNRAPAIGGIEREQRKQWMRPEGGFLVGKVDRVATSTLVLTDPENKKWTVYLPPDQSAVAVGERAGIEGEVVNADERTFRACMVRSLEFSGERHPPFPGGKKSNARKGNKARSTTCEGVRPR